MFDRTELPTLGVLTAKLKHPRTETVIDVEFYVTNRDDPILGTDACRRLDMLRIVEQNICELTPATSTPPQPPLSLSKRVTAIKQFADLFHGTLGHLEGDVHLDTDIRIFHVFYTDVAPVQMPLRHLPVALRDRESKHSLTRWSKMTSSRQSLNLRGGCRRCLSSQNSRTESGSALTPLNRALQRSVYYMLTIDDKLLKLSNAKVFSTVDAKSAFWQLKLDEQSSM